MEQRNYTRTRWHLLLTEDEVSELMQMYHFDSSQQEVLAQVYQNLQKRMLPEADLRFADAKVREMLPFINENQYIIGAITLGDGVDKLLQFYYQTNRVMEAYAADCLCMALLRKSYEQFEEFVYEECGQWAEKYEFVGDKYPLETIPQILSCLPQTVLRANPAYALLPGKSVLFVSALSEERKGCALRLCEECSANNCINKKRAKNYGEMQIFGKGLSI